MKKTLVFLCVIMLTLITACTNTQKPESLSNEGFTPNIATTEADNAVEKNSPTPTPDTQSGKLPDNSPSPTITDDNQAIDEETPETEPTQNESESNSIQTSALPSEVFYGKVKKIIGNEIEVELGVIPDWNGDSSAKAGNDNSGGESSQKVTIIENAPGQEDYFAPDPDNSIFGADGEINLSYTGETLSFTVPAGVKIYNILGTAATLDAIKKGSILMVKPVVIDGVATGVDILTILR